MHIFHPPDRKHAALQLIDTLGGFVLLACVILICRYC